MTRSEAQLTHMLKTAATLTLAIVELEANAFSTRCLRLQEQLLDLTLSTFPTFALALSLEPTIMV